MSRDKAHISTKQAVTDLSSALDCIQISQGSRNNMRKAPTGSFGPTGSVGSTSSGKSSLQRFKQPERLRQVLSARPSSPVAPQENTGHVGDTEGVRKLREIFSGSKFIEGFTLISHRSAPNGFKVAIVLSELGYKYDTILLDFANGDQKSPEFLSINPNGRVPALIDHTNPEQPVTLWESGAIILYLVEKKSREEEVCPSIWAESLVEQSQIMSWLFFQTSGHSPMIGQALHFKYFHTISIPSAIERYTDEVRRVYGVLEVALSEKREALIMELDRENADSYSAGLTPMSHSRYFDTPVWLVGERATVADLCFVTWNYVVDRIGIDLKAEFPEVYKWTKHMMGRPAVMHALKWSGDQ